MPLEQLSKEVSGDISLAIGACRQMENLLYDLGAIGRGAHAKLTFVENKIQKNVLRKARLIATVRNKVVHENTTIKNRKGFRIAAEIVVDHLENLVANKLAH